MNTPILSKTEQDIIEMRIQGYTRKEIADKTFRSELTIKTHFQNILKKLNANDEIEAVTGYINHKLNIDVKKLLKVSATMAAVILLIYLLSSQDNRELIYEISCRLNKVFR